MKKAIIILTIFLVQTFNGISSANKPLKTHCLFMTYNFTFNGNVYQGSGFYCIEWFWRTGGENPAPGETTKATLKPDERLVLSQGDQALFTKDQNIEVTLENVKYKFAILKGNYKVNSDGKIECVAKFIE